MGLNTKTLIEALRILARDIQSDDGVANAAIAQAANRLEEFRIKYEMGSGEEKKRLFVCPDCYRAEALNPETFEILRGIGCRSCADGLMMPVYASWAAKRINTDRHFRRKFAHGCADAYCAECDG